MTDYKHEPGKASDLAIDITRLIFGAMSNGDDKAQRIEFKGGNYPDSETNLGGFCESAFAKSLDGWMKQAMSKQTTVSDDQSQ